MFEHKTEKLIPKSLFIKRLIWHFMIAALVITGSLFMGVLGYHLLGKLTWIDSLLNAAMILGGMGPVNEITSNAGKYFATFYALFSGIVFLVTAAILFGPATHRMLHKFHIDMDE